jgi:hypothetical protein
VWKINRNIELGKIRILKKRRKIKEWTNRNRVFKRRKWIERETFRKINQINRRNER